MNPADTTRPDDDRDDRLSALLRSAGAAAPAPDGDLLARLRESSTAAFAAGQPTPSPVRPKGRAMIPRLLGALAATAVAAAVLALTLFMIPNKPGDKPAGPIALAKVLDDTANASVVQFKVTAGGATREIAAEKGGRWREDTGTGVAYVSDGEIVWRVEKDGKASRANAKPPRDLMALVLAGQKHHQVDLSKQQPSGTEKRGEIEYVVYKVDVEAEGGGIKVEALVDSATKNLHSLTARAGDKVLSELLVTSIGGDLPEDKFLVLNSLSEDGRIGKVGDTQGIVSVKPMAQGRWTPVTDNFVVMPGDWLRTDVRGANAAAVKLISRAGVILGPGSLAELTRPTQIKLIEGELEISTPKGTSLELVGPEDQRVVVKGTQHYYLDRTQKLRLSAREPLWLKGFKGATANESIGSLVAKVDGRSEPLSVGYHKVMVDIRDQIARTTIEESFVNHTDATLEGVFHFPLPQDASISEFGMWIGNELVMADVVEKQRAREIYEQIMREKRDPGLLEWAGGNIFKARVWPIFGGSEKRIKISYTQVLPLKGGRYTYSYALQSEMLQQHPLRELSLTVNVASAVPLKKVWSPTHATRDQATANAARVEFAAQEYTPRKDFEVVVEQDRRASDVVLVPHRRGSDGYLMLQVMPPSPSLERAILPDAGPVRLLILADTSASMDRRQRQQQEAFIAALVSALTPKDTFNLACCDVSCDWAFEKPVSAEAKNLIAARDMLQNRVSLGWTDLDKAFASVQDSADEHTHVVYVGDGIPVTTDADPVAFARRLKAMHAGKPGTFHAVATGSSFEPGVLKAVASLGGGSWRRIGGEHGPSVVALELLREVAQPTLRDVKVEFAGLRTAKVYPEELPNVPAGTQQILLGRYLPEGRDQEGEVIVTGTLDGKPVRMVTRVSLKDAEQGNSFIPRLWARMHLDALLEMGTSEAIKDEVIALSEEFNIMTPYTSFLVLESDADRERFGVKKRFRMRDGEKFFAEGRDNVDFALVQQQMKRAGTWRVNLRREALRSLSGLGRDLRLVQRQYQRLDEVNKLSKSAELIDGLSNTIFFDSELGEGRGFGGGGGFGPMGTGPVGRPALHSRMLANGSAEELGLPQSGVDGPAEMPADEVGKDKKDEPQAGEPDSSEGDDKRKGGEADGDGYRQLRDEDGRLEEKASIKGDKDMALNFAGANGPAASMSAMSGRKPMFGYRLADFDEQAAQSETYGRGFYYLRSKRERGRGDDSLYWQQQWWGTLFPPLPPAAKARVPEKSNWPEAARKLAQSLLRRDKLRQINGGLELRQTTQSFDARYNELTGRGHGLNLYSPKSWLTRSRHDGQQTVIDWCDGAERGLIHGAFQVGRIRPAKPEDLTLNLPLSDFSLTALDEDFSAYKPTIEDAGKDQDRPQVRLVLTYEHNEVRLLIDTARHVLLEIEYRTEGKVTSKTRFGDFVEAAGCWWARKAESFNEKGARTNLTTFEVKELSADGLAGRVKEELAAREQTLLVKFPLPKVADARKALAAGKPTLEDQIVLMQHFVAIQQWAKAREHLEAVEKLTDKPAKRWLRDAVLHMSRRFDELRQRHIDEAAKLAESTLPANDRYVLAQHLWGRSSQFMQAAELLPLLETLRPVYTAQPVHVRAMKDFERNRYYQISNLGRAGEAQVTLKKLAIDYPRDESLQREYAQTLFNNGDFASGYAWLEKALAANPRWEEYEQENLRNQYVQYLTQQGRVEDLLKYAQEWMKSAPTSRTSYAIYLGSLIRLGQEDKANETMTRWFKEGQVRGVLPPEVAGRLGAAIAQAMGQGYNMYTYRIDERWVPTLVGVVKFFAHDERNGHFADQVMAQLQNQPGDEVGKLRRDLAADLLAAVPKLTPDRVSRLVNWLNSYNDADFWVKFSDALRQRWQAEKEPRVRTALGGVLVSVLQQHRTPEDVLAFMRLQLKAAEAKERPAFARQLFDTLIAQPWKQAYEDEAFALLPTLGEGPESVDLLRFEIDALYRLTDRMVAARTEALNAKIDRPDKLTRIELRDRHAANFKTARAEFADRLGKEMANAPKDLVAWLKMERMYLDTLLERNLAQVEADCWEILGNDPPRPVDPDAEPKPREAIEGVLKERAFATLNFLATRRKADAASVDRLLKYLDKGIAREGDSAAWKTAKHRLLVAIDRPKELEKDLAQWVAKSPQPNYWRLNLGFLVAELGRLKEAVALFEKVRADNELGPFAFRTLADWYMVLNRKDDHERALLDQYRFTEENQLSRMIQSRLYPWQRGDNHLPTELDKDVLRMFAVLFEKSASPANYVYQLQAFYQACRDFRLLAVLADAMVGQTPVKVYPFLQALGHVFNSIQDEAVVDQMMEQLARTRQNAKTAVDRRALDLTEALVRRRAAEMKNQPGPHGDLALAAMKRAFDREWTSGEQPLMAQMLLSMSNIAYGPMAEEQRREMKWLYEQQKKASDERLRVGHYHAQLLNYYGRNDEAIDVLTAELADYLAVRGGDLPANVNDVASTLVSIYQQTMRHVKAEQFLQGHLKHPANDEQRFWLTERLDNVYHDAFSRDGEVSLGKGNAIYSPLEKKLRADVSQANPQHQYQIVSLACQVYGTAKQKQVPFRDDLLGFGNKLLPEVLKNYHNYYDSVINQVASTIRTLLGPVEAIEFVLNRIEKEPAWFRLNSQDGWSRHGSSLAVWRGEARDIGALEPRLLKLVLSELRRDLDTLKQTNRAMYYRPSGYYWAEKEDDFIKVAEDVYGKRQGSPASVVYIAQYFYYGLGRPARAIEVLFAAHQRKLLDESGITILVQFLREQNRHGEAVALLEALVGQHPENLTYRVWLMNSYFHTRMLDKLRAALKDAHAYFHAENRWNEGACAALGASTLENELWPESAEYYKEAIPLHQRSAPNRGIGDGVLAEYYANLARAYGRQGMTLEAVDAASGAIVAWPSYHPSRRHYIDRLREVMTEAKDLDAFITKLDAREKESGLGSPVVRKAAGQAYQSRGQFDKAIAQYRVALELQPEDFETHDQMIACFDQTNNKEGAIAATLEAIQLARRNLALYKKLGDRYAALQRNADAERAFTSLVEMQPNESESHTMLAQVRQQQDRWDEAAAHWEQAAKMRALEPTALIELARAQMHLKAWDKADTTITKLERTVWPARFDNQREAIHALRRQLPKQK